MLSLVGYPEKICGHSRFENEEHTDSRKGKDGVWLIQMSIFLYVFCALLFVSLYRMHVCANFIGKALITLPESCHPTVCKASVLLSFCKI